jgi:hypothetical protein
MLIVPRYVEDLERRVSSAEESKESDQALQQNLNSAPNFAELSTTGELSDAMTSRTSRLVHRITAAENDA